MLAVFTGQYTVQCTRPLHFAAYILFVGPSEPMDDLGMIGSWILHTGKHTQSQHLEIDAVVYGLLLLRM